MRLRRSRGRSRWLVQLSNRALRPTRSMCWRLVIDQGAGSKSAPELENLLRGWRRWRSGPVFGAKVRDHLGDFRVGEGVAKGRHFLAALENLGSDFGRGPELVLAQAGQVRSFFAAAAARAVAVGAAQIGRAHV